MDHRNAPHVVRKRTNGSLPWLLGLAAVLIVLSVAVPFGYPAWRSLGSQEIPIRYTVTNEYRIGFALGTGDLNFGHLNPGAGGTRGATLNTVTPVDAIITIPPDLLGKLAVKPSNPIRLEPGQPVNITFDLSLPEDEPLGEHQTSIVVSYLRRFPWE